MPPLWVSRAGKSRPDELSTDEALDFVDQMAAMQVREVTLIGGEAYWREDWLTLIARIRERGMNCSTTTGGRGLTHEMAVEAQRAGLQAVSVSVDGLRDYHDMLRGVQGSWDAAMNAMDAGATGGLAT